MEIEQRYEIVALDGDEDVLKPHPQNPNQSDDDLIGESIDMNGWYGAVIAQESTGYILAGHGRLRAAIEQGATSIPVIWRDVDDETALRILLADNEIARKGVIQEEQLHEILSSLSTLEGTGYGKVTHKLEERLAKEAEAEAAKEQAKDVDPTGPSSTSSEATSGAGTPSSDSDTPGDSSTSPGSSADPTVAVPKDVYTPSFGIMVVCYSESDQEAVYLALQDIMGRMNEDEAFMTLHGPDDMDQDGEPMKRQLRVVAV